MSIAKKFEIETSRVKGLCFHPTRPWILTTMHSGIIEIWDFNMKVIIAHFDEGEGPVRGCDFHPHLPLFVTGSDSGNLRVWNYKQKRCQFILKGHIDYIRTAYFHHELPWILSASDDQTMRIWNYQSRNCVNIITGHSHFVMCAQFHHEKNYIVSASLDSTVRIWDYSILRKKLTESTGPAGFIGIEIECIKILEGHERGVNWACFHPTSNLIASGSDDRKIKLWKYTNEIAWEHSTILGHKNNVSCLFFDPVSENLITNSEDKTIRIWNIESKTEIATEKKLKARNWILAVRPNGTLFASGHDEGFDVFNLNMEVVPYAVISSDLIVFAQGLNSYLYSVKEKKEKMELYQFKAKTNLKNCFVNQIVGNPFDNSSFKVEIKELLQPENSYMIKKKEAYLNFPSVSKEFTALDCCFLNADTIVVLTSPSQLKVTQFVNKKNDDKVITFGEPSSIERIFNSNKKNEIIIFWGHNKRLSTMQIEEKKPKARMVIEEGIVENIVFGFSNIAILCENSVIIMTEKWEKLCTIKEPSAIKSVFWESENILFYTTINHLKYSFLNGETGVIKTIDEPLHLLQKLEGNKFLVFNEKQKVFEIQFPDYSEIEFKMAISERNINKIKTVLEKIKATKKKVLIKQLVEKGYAELALTFVTDPEERFSLAIQSSDFTLAFEICNKKNTQEAWNMLGEEALKQGIYEAYELACQKLKKYDELNFLYSLQNNNEKLEKMSKLANKTDNSILAFNTNLFLNKGEVYSDTLSKAGLDALARLSKKAFSEDQTNDPLLVKLGSRPLVPMEVVGDDNSANWPHNIEEEEEEEEEDQ